METLIMVMMIVVGINFILKISFLRTWQFVAILLLCAVAVFVSVDWASQQSRAQISAWLAQPKLMADTAVVLSIDILLYIAFCLSEVRNLFRIKSHPKPLWQKVVRIFLRIYPGIAVVPLLGYLLVNALYLFIGYDFWYVGLGLSVAVFAVDVLSLYGLRVLLPESDLRLEILFLLSLTLWVLCVVCTVNGQTAVSGQDSVNLTSLLGVVALIGTFGIAGHAIYIFRHRKQ